MEQKRAAVAPIASKAGIPSKTYVGKTVSSVSMSPSQMAAAEAAKARKHPLDALSRNVFQPNVSRRSGLQDVDEEFLKQNIFCRQNVNRHSGLNESNMFGMNMQNQHAAGQPSGMALNAMQQQQHQHQQQQQQAHPPPPQQHIQPQYQTAPTPQQQHIQPQMAMHSPGDGQPQMQYVAAPAIVQPQVQQIPQPTATMPAAGQPSVQMAAAAPAPQVQAAPQAVSQMPPQQHIPVSPAAPANVPAAVPQTMPAQQCAPAAPVPPQSIPPPAAMPQAAAPPQPEPDMCTTCPNCQTTIYLVRPDAPEMQQMEKAQ